MNRSMLFLAAVAFSCGDNQAAFRPTDNVTQSAPGGAPAASYEIRGDAESDAHARVNVWSRGVFEDDDHQAFAYFGVELRNLGDQTISLDTSELRLDPYTNDARQLARARLVRGGEALFVPPGEAAKRNLVYYLGRIEPDDIGSMRLRWVVDHEDGQRYVQFTDFRRIPEYVVSSVYYYDPIYGYYDPFLYGPPYAYHLNYHAPVRRVIVTQRDR